MFNNTNQCMQWYNMIMDFNRISTIKVGVPSTVCKGTLYFLLIHSQLCFCSSFLRCFSQSFLLEIIKKTGNQSLWHCWDLFWNYTKKEENWETSNLGKVFTFSPFRLKCYFLYLIFLKIYKRGICSCLRVLYFLLVKCSQNHLKT